MTVASGDLEYAIALEHVFGVEEPSRAEIERELAESGVSAAEEPVLEAEIRAILASLRRRGVVRLWLAAVVVLGGLLVVGAVAVLRGNGAKDADRTDEVQSPNQRFFESGRLGTRDFFLVPAVLLGPSSTEEERKGALAEVNVKLRHLLEPLVERAADPGVPALIAELRAVLADPVVGAPMPASTCESADMLADRLRLQRGAPLGADDAELVVDYVRAGVGLLWQAREFGGKVEERALSYLQKNRDRL